MRHVYSPAPARSGGLWPIIGALVLTLAVFLVLPLTQMVSSRAHKETMLSRINTTELAPPVADTEPPPPEPPPEEEPEPPPPQLSDTPPPMNLSIDLDIVVGTGGALAGAAGMFGATGEGQNLLDTFSMEDLEKKPELVAAVPPQYPPEMRKAKVEGAVTIVCVLDESGRVEDPRIETSSRPEFERAALDAVRRWKFRPGMREGEAVRTYMRLPIRFSINS